MASKFDVLFDAPKGQPLPVQAPTPKDDKYGVLFDTPTAPLHSSLYEAADTNPDTQARNAQLSKQLGVPAGILPANAEQQALMLKNPADELLRNSPATAKFLTDTDNAKVTGLKGVQSLVDLEKAHKSYSPENIKTFINSSFKSPAEAAQELTKLKAKGVDLKDLVTDRYARENRSDVLGDVAKSLAGGVNTAAAWVNEAAHFFDTPMRALQTAILPETMAKIEAKFSETQTSLKENEAYWQGQKSAGLQAEIEDYNKAGWAESLSMLAGRPELLVDQLAYSAPSTLIGGPVSRLGTKAALAYATISEAADAANSARQEAAAAGRSLEEQNRAANVAAIITAPFVFLGNKLTGVSKLEAEFFKKGTLGGNLLLAAVKEAFAGGVEESANQYGVNKAAQEYDPLRSDTAGVAKAFAVGGALESTQAVGMRSAEKALNAYVNAFGKVNDAMVQQSNAAAEGLAAHDTLESLGAQTANSELKGRSPEAFNDFINTMTEDAQLQEVFVAPETIAPILEGNYAELKQSAPELVASMEEAITLQHDVKISVADYLTHIAGTPIEQTILPELKASPEGSTYKVAQEFYKNQEQIFQTAISELDANNGEVLTKEEFTALKAQKPSDEISTPLEEQKPSDEISTPLEKTPNSLPETYEQYVAEHENKREVYERDVKGVEDTIRQQFQQAGRFTSSVNRSYTTPLVEFYKTQAKNFGVSPSEMYAKYPLRVQSFLNNVATEELNQEGASPLAEGFKTLTQNDEVFQYPISKATDLQQVFNDIAPSTVHVEKAFTADKAVADMYAVFPIGKNGETLRDQIGYVSVFNDGKVEINVANWEEGYGGSSVYSAVGNWAYNNGKVFAGDRDGISPKGAMRRLENMISLALKFGTTDFITPHPNQMRELGFNWREGDTAYNIEQMLQASYIAVRKGNYVTESQHGVEVTYKSGNAVGVAKIDDLVYNPKSAQFEEVSSGKQFTDEQFAKLAKTKEARAVSAGSTTLKRAALSNTFLRGQDNGSLQQLLEQFSELSNQSLLGNQLNGSFYQSSFYSALTRSVEESKQAKGSSAQWKGIIKNMAGVKASEIEATGVNDWLDLQQGSVSKEDLLNYLNANGVQVTETVLGESDRINRGSKYAIPEVMRLVQQNQGQMDNALAVSLANDGDAYRALMSKFPELEEDENWEETVLEDVAGGGQNAVDTKYEGYTVAGGENYKELLLTLPSDVRDLEQWEVVREDGITDGRYASENSAQKRAEAIKGTVRKGANQKVVGEFRSSHFDQANILAHVRFDERVDADGNKVLFINEIQSDWGQKGKKEGFTKEPTAEELAKEKELVDEVARLSKGPKAEYEKTVSELYQLRRKIYDAKVPSAPFVTDTKAWVSLVFKRMLQYAADNNFAKIAIINGEQAAGLYDLSKQVDAIHVVKKGGLFRVFARTTDGKNVDLGAKTADELPEAIGKDLAKRVATQTKDLEIYEGEDLKVGGEGMKAFYDKIVPNIANDILKKLGGGLEPVSIASTDKDTDRYSVVLPNGKVVKTSNNLTSAEATAKSFEGAVVQTNESVVQQLGVTMTPDLVAKVQSGLPLFQGARGSFNLETLTMTLLQGADLSTVIHESGHFYLKMLQDLAARADAPEQVKSDYQKTLDWFGVSHSVWSSMSLNEQRPYHEQWAENFERWNFEGIAPTQELQPVFSRFRAWMKSVYTTMDNFLRLNPSAGKLNDEVRGIFGRLLASEEAIAATEASRGYQPLYATAKDAGVSEAVFNEHVNLGLEATQIAVDNLQERSMRDMRWASNSYSKALRRIQALAKVTRHKIEAEVSKEVMSEPVNQARSFLRTGKTTDPKTGDTIEVAKGYKLSKEAIEQAYPPGALGNPDLTALHGMTAEEGLAPDMVANMFGFASGDALIHALINGENAKQKIEGLTDQRMLEEHGDLTDQQSIERAASEAVHNEVRAKFLATGLKILSKSPISVSQMTKAAKSAADATIANKKVRDLKPNQYTAAEARANKAVLKALPKDPVAAVQAQRAALLNFRLAASALEAINEVEKALKYLAKFNNDGTRKNLDLSYLEQIDALLAPFDLRKGVSLSTIDSNTSLSEWIAEQEALGYEPTIDPEQIAALKQKSYKNMTMEELRGLIDTVKQIEHMGRNVKKLLTAIERESFLERIAEAKASIAINADRVVKEKGTPSDVLGHLGQWGRQMAAEHRKFSSFLRQLDGGKNNGVLFNLLVRPMGVAGNAETQMKSEAGEALGKLFDPIAKEISTFGNIYAPRKLIAGTNLSLTNEERLMFAANVGNEGNHQRLRDGGITGKKALSEAEIQAVLDTLTPKELTFIQGVFDYLNTFKPLIEAQERRLTGKTPTWLEAKPIVTKNGTIPGGYLPAKYDAQLSTRSLTFEAAANVRSMMAGAFGKAAARNSYTKDRASKVVGRPMLLNFGVLSSHVNEVVHRLAWQEFLIDAKRVLGALDNDIRTHLGAEGIAELNATIDDIAAGDKPAENAKERMFNRLRTGTTIVGLGWKVSVAMMQPIGLSNSIARVGALHMAKGLGRFIANPIETSRWVESNSVGMRNRNRTLSREMNEVLNTVRAGDKATALEASYFYLIGKAQRMTDIPTYLGAYEQTLADQGYESAAKGSERDKVEATAHAVAYQTVVDTQGDGSLQNLSRVQRGSPLSKLFTNFYSYMNTVYNNNIENYRRTDFKSPSEFGLFVADTLLLNFVPAVLTMSLKNALKGDCDWDDTVCLAEKYKSEQLSALFGQMIGLREASIAAGTLTGGEGFGYSGPAGLRFFADLFKFSQQAHQGDADLPLFKAANNTAGAVLHYPAGAINNAVDGIIAVENGEVEGFGILPALVAGAPK